MEGGSHARNSRRYTNYSLAAGPYQFLHPWRVDSYTARGGTNRLGHTTPDATPRPSRAAALTAPVNSPGPQGKIVAERRLLARPPRR
jgi:hypothetical protein